MPNDTSTQAAAPSTDIVPAAPPAKPASRWSLGSKNATSPEPFKRKRSLNAHRVKMKEVWSPERLVPVYEAMLMKAAGGDVSAAKLIFEQLMGSPAKFHVVESIQAIEQVLGLADGEAAE